MTLARPATDQACWRPRTERYCDDDFAGSGPLARGAGGRSRGGASDAAELRGTAGRSFRGSPFRLWAGASENKEPLARGGSRRARRRRYRPGGLCAAYDSQRLPALIGSGCGDSPAPTLLQGPSGLRFWTARKPDHSDVRFGSQADAGTTPTSELTEERSWEYAAGSDTGSVEDAANFCG